MRGFIVVLVNPKDFLTTEDNPTYRGVDRLPPYSHKIPEESEAIDEYVFGDYKSKEGAIPTLEKAQELLQLFRHSRRQFEIIYYETMDENPRDRPRDALRLQLPDHDMDLNVLKVFDLPSVNPRHHH